jgi:chorismate mutase
MRALVSRASAVLVALLVITVGPVHGATATERPGESLVRLTGLSAERVLLADKVAAAKFGTPAPIDDPAREQVVLDTVRTLSIDMGIDPNESIPVFRDQIEANKQVQRHLYALWTAHPELAPTERPDLATEVRPQLDRITRQLLEQLKATDHTRTHPSCSGRLLASQLFISHTQNLDRPHRTALNRSLTSVCDRPSVGDFTFPKPE